MDGVLRFLNRSSHERRKRSYFGQAMAILPESRSIAGLMSRCENSKEPAKTNTSPFRPKQSKDQTGQVKATENENVTGNKKPSILFCGTTGYTLVIERFPIRNEFAERKLAKALT
jgi:hypothetical protein